VIEEEVCRLDGQLGLAFIRESLQRRLGEEAATVLLLGRHCGGAHLFRPGGSCPGGLHCLRAIGGIGFSLCSRLFNLRQLFLQRGLSKFLPGFGTRRLAYRREHLGRRIRKATEKSAKNHSGHAHAVLHLPSASPMLAK
jgi:hypothetical protein